jgi:hypothetical protein
MRLGVYKVRPHKRGIKRAQQMRVLFASFIALAIFIPYSAISHYNAKADCACSVFGTPTGQADYNNGSPLEVGVKVIPDQDGYISGVRFYKEGVMSGTHTGTLWSTGGTALATATFTNETASGWQDVTFSPSVAVTAGTTYIASVTMNDGHYTATSNYFTTSITNGPLTAPSSSSSGGNGVFGNPGVVPSQTFNAGNYWIDVSFFGTTAPTVSSVTPTTSATGVLPGVTVSASFSQSMSAASLTSGTVMVKDDSGTAVSGTVAYDSVSKTVSFVADQGFTTNTHYTVTIKGGTGTVAKNTAGIALASDYTWSFTTAATNSCPCSLKDKAAPVGTGTFSETSGVELGVKIKPSTNGYISSLRFYKPITSTDTSNTGHVWDSSGHSLATVSFTNETSYGWQEAKLATPLRVYQNQLYIISYTASSTVYVSSASVFSGTDMTSGYLTAYATGSSQNAATGSGNNNGVFNTTAGSYPSSGSNNGQYYWVDAVFSVGSTVSNPLAVSATQPTNKSYGIQRTQTITAKFNHQVDGSTITNSTFRLFDAAGNQVSGTASYDANSGQAVFTPSGALAYGQVYTAKLAATVADYASVTLGNEYSWSFTVGSQLSSDPTQGAGGPILVITSSGNTYGKYYAEILRAEGLNEFSMQDINNVTSSMLANYKAVIVPEMSLTQAQVDMLSSWTTAGGQLVAMRPDAKLAGLLGITPSGTTRVNQYVKVDTSKPAGSGIYAQPMQYKGTVDNYSLNGAAALATIYSDASTQTSNPAVTSKSVGSNNGTAIAFTYDLAKSTIGLHQGNQAWVGQERDGVGPIRSNDLFYGAKTGDIQPDWLNTDRAQIPQADEQQRFFANILIDATKKTQPLPRFWYLPDGYTAAMVLAGDDHGQSNANGTEMVMNNWLNNSDANCSLIDWQCVRATHYIYTSSALTNTRATQYYNLGFEIGDHVGTSCNNYSSYASLLSEYQSNLSTWRAKYTGLPNQVSHRYHCYVWSDWDSQIKVDAALGIRYDLNYLAYPASWLSGKGTVITGSGGDMRFTDASGNLMDVRQAVTNFDNQTMNATDIATALDNATGANGYYGIFGTHYDMSDSYDKTLFAAAYARHIPMISSAQALTWLDGRDSSTMTNFAGGNGQYSFTVAAAVGANGLHAMLPISDGDGTIQTLVDAGTNVTYQTQTIKGIQYAVFDAAPGLYQVTYSDYHPVSPQPAASSSSDSQVLSNKKSEALGLSTTDKNTPTESAAGQQPSSATSESHNSSVLESGTKNEPASQATGELPTWAKVTLGATVAVAVVGGGVATVIRLRRHRIG